MTEQDSTSKKCCTCKIEKPRSEFGPMARKKDGLRPNCKPCKAAESRLYRQRNPEKSKEATKRWAVNNRSRKLAYDRAWLEANKEWADERLRIWTAKNKDRIKEKADERRKLLHVRINHALSTRLYLALKGKAGKKTKDILGYTTQELIVHLERQFTEGMSWDNYGQWHVDHIKPIASFSFTGPDDPEILRAWGLPNLRPLWATENHKKHAKITHLI
jgi:hypothetical protein